MPSSYGGDFIVATTWVDGAVGGELGQWVGSRAVNGEQGSRWGAGAVGGELRQWVGSWAVNGEPGSRWGAGAVGGEPGSGWATFHASLQLDATRASQHKKLWTLGYQTLLACLTCCRLTVVGEGIPRDPDKTSSEALGVCRYAHAILHGPAETSKLS